MEHTTRTPDYVLDRLHNVPCWECGGVGEIDMLPEWYRGPTGNTPFGTPTPCPACGGAGFQMEVWERVE